MIKPQMRGLTETPEFPVVIFSFLLHFVWEFLQVPMFDGMAEMSHWEAVKLCLSATVGDVGFALTAFWAASLFARSRSWFESPQYLPFAVFIAVGVLLTVAFEYYYVNVSLRWTYSDAMPLVPPFGTGLSPLLQWLIVPIIVIWLARRHILGARVLRGSRT